MWLGVDDFVDGKYICDCCIFDSGADLAGMVANLWSRQSCYPVDFP